MLNQDLFVIYPEYPKASFIPFSFAHVSDKAWTFACNASYMTTLFNQEGYQNDILAVIEEKGNVLVVLSDAEGNVIIQECNLEE